MNLIHGAYYWLRVLALGDAQFMGLPKNENMVVGQYNADYHQFDLCGDEEGWGEVYFEVLEMIEYKGNK